MSSRCAIALVASLALHAGVAGLLRLAPGRAPVPEQREAHPVEVEIVETTQASPAGEGAETPGPEAPALRRAARAPRREASLRVPVRVEAPAAAPAAAPEPAKALDVAPTMVASAEGLAADFVARDGPEGEGVAGGAGGEAGIAGGAGTGEASGTGGAGGEGASERGSGALLAEVSRLLSARASGCYPRAARRFGMEGTAKVRFCIGEAGEPTDTTLLESSGNRLLDEGAFCTVAQAAPFPASGECVTVPIRFSLAR